MARKGHHSGVLLVAPSGHTEGHFGGVGPGDHPDGIAVTGRHGKSRTMQRVDYSVMRKGGAGPGQCTICGGSHPSSVHKGRKSPLIGGGGGKRIGLSGFGRKLQ